MVAVSEEDGPKRTLWKGLKLCSKRRKLSISKIINMNNGVELRPRCYDKRIVKETLLSKAACYEEATAISL